ncbi:polysaccharide pyruvyl transferase family protein [Rhizobium sp. G21]|uniref:polysaccharide pyruvyl transferase family protein n=1 Tax=Rhizobium sp. G21 TaxID=2758439 RepID=UPI001602F328|nr:polysaccharide pyruvyl transferase family protein [Rhizobium sp. G21]MBB1248549.1 polysaccharide pyruvyl transferase family protein [Rhizobium sp. G21]
MHFILIANSEISIEALPVTENEPTIIVQFNKCRNDSLISGLNVERWYVFNTPLYGLPHGFSDVDEAPCDVSGGKVYFAVRDLHENKLVEQIQSRFGGEMLCFSEKLGAYDLRKLGFAPSIGYQIAMYASMLGGRVTLVGFSGDFSDGGWIGHNFDLEQMLLKKQSSISFLGGELQPNLSMTTAFERVFGEAYDFTAPAPRQMLDIAKGFWRAGEHKLAKRFIENAQYRNPSLSRVLDEMAALDELDRQEHLFPHSVIKQYWRDGKGVRKDQPRFDFSGSTYEYSLIREGRGRVLLMNNTERLDINKHHVGCKLVMSQIRSHLEQRGLQVVGWVNDLDDGFNAILDVDPQLDGVDAIVVNGEGTFHNNAPRAVSLLLLCERIKADFHKKLIFLNGVWQENNAFVTAALEKFDIISVRDRRSQTELRRKTDVVYNPDMTWSLSSGAPQEPQKDLAFIDSIYQNLGDRLMQVAVDHGKDYWIMGGYYKNVYAMLKASRRLPLVATDGNEFAAYQAVITGRYHGACLALLAGCSVLYTPSNSHKTEAMFDEIGLQGKEFTFGSPIEIEPYTQKERDRVTAFRLNASASIGKTFDDVAACVVS